MTEYELGWEAAALGLNHANLTNDVRFARLKTWHQDERDEFERGQLDQMDYAHKNKLDALWKQCNGIGPRQNLTSSSSMCG